MVALDTNVLVRATLGADPRHAIALGLVQSLADGTSPWCVPWPCVYEFLRVVTHPRFLARPVPVLEARRRVAALHASPSCRFIGETERHAEVLDHLLASSGATGNLVFDAHVAALCIEHGVSELLTADADFGRFPGLRTRDPFRAA
jgi:toxin-antitoxin system PIN domain toxin